MQYMADIEMKKTRERDIKNFHSANLVMRLTSGRFSAVDRHLKESFEKYDWAKMPTVHRSQALDFSQRVHFFGTEKKGKYKKKRED